MPVAVWNRDRFNVMRKRSYQDQLRTQIRQWQDRIDDLRARAGASGAGSRRQVDEQIEDLRAKQDAARRKLAQLDRRPGGIRQGSRARAAGVRDKVQRVVRRIVPGMR